MLSPTADKVLFSTVAGHYLYIANADGTNLFMLAASSSVYVPKFSPDGKYIETINGRVWDCSDCTFPHKRENAIKLLEKLFK